MKKTILCLIISLGAVTTEAQRVYTLQQLKDSALQNNIAIRSARHQIDAAALQRKEAYTKYFPNVSGTGLMFNANRGMAKTTMNPSELITPEMGATLSQMLPAEALAALGNPISISMMKNGAIGSLMAVQPVYAGGQIVNGNRLAKVGEDVSHLQLQLSENEVERQTEQYYWQLVTLQEKVKTIETAQAFLASIYKDVDVAVKAGVTLPGDLLAVQLRQNDTESKKVTLLNGISVVRMLLAQYCGLHTDDIAVAPAQMDSIGATAAPPSTLAALPEYQLLQKQVEASRLQRKMEEGKTMPTVGVGAGYNYHNLLDRSHTFAMVFATVSVPISDWWGGTHAVKRKKIAELQAEEQLADNAQLLRIRMTKAYNDVEEARQQIAIAQRSIEQAEDNLRHNRDYYRAGTSKMSDLLEAQMQYQQALDRRTDAYADLQNKLLEYRQATGL